MRRIVMAAIALLCLTCAQMLAQNESITLPSNASITSQPVLDAAAGTFSTSDASGKTTQLMDMQVVGIILEQFYQRTQVMIGEAISVSELRSLVREKSSAFGIVEPPANGRDKP